MFYRKEWVNMYKRILSFLLVTAILVCAMPFSALTVAAAESGSGEAERLPLYTEDFELAAEGHVGNRVGGWTVTAQKDKATVEIAQVEGRGKVLKITQLGGASVNTRLDFVLPGTTGYSEATVSFDLYATKGAWLNSMGLRGSSTSWPRSYVSMKDNVLKDGVSGTALVENWEEKWYHIEIVASLDADNNRIYDVSIDGVPVRAGQLDHNATKFMGVMLELSRGAAATVMLDNVSVTAGEAAVATLDFENLQAGAVDVLEGWKVATHSRAATVTVTQLEDEAHGKVLKMTQTGLETDNSDGDKSIRAFYYMEAAYKNADLSFDVQVVQERSIFTGALGNANEDLTTTWLRGGLQMRKREFRDVTGNNTITGTHVPDTWHKVRLAYRYDEQANAYHYHVYFDGEQIYTGLAATAKVAVTTFLFELARNYAGEVYVDNIVVSDPTREPTAPFEGVEYLGHDTVTKHQWIGTYGASQAILFAKMSPISPILPGNSPPAAERSSTAGPARTTRTTSAIPTVPSGWHLIRPAAVTGASAQRNTAWIWKHRRMRDSTPVCSTPTPWQATRIWRTARCICPGTATSSVCLIQNPMCLPFTATTCLRKRDR